MKTIEQILERPENYIGSLDRREEMLWVWKDEKMVKQLVNYVPGLYNIFDQVLLNAAEKKQQHSQIDRIQVNFDFTINNIEVRINGAGIPVEEVYAPERLVGEIPTWSNIYANVFSTRFKIQTADGKQTYEQEFANNMKTKRPPKIEKCDSTENWTIISFTHDLSKFDMENLDINVVDLMKKRVIDLAACVGNNVEVVIDEKRVSLETFEEYAKLYLESDTICYSSYEKWEICVGKADHGHFDQISFVNNIATTEGGTHVDIITDQIIAHFVRVMTEEHPYAHLKDDDVKNHLWVFVNVIVENPTFSSLTKEKLTTPANNFSTCQLTTEFLKNAIKKKKLNIDKLEDAKKAGSNDSAECTLILTEGDSSKAFAMCGLGIIGRDKYGVYPLQGKLVNVRGLSAEQLEGNPQIQHIIEILGLRYGEVYGPENIDKLRYGHLMIMADQVIMIMMDGSHIKGLVINFLHNFWPSLLSQVPKFLQQFITPIMKASHTIRNTVVPVYSIHDYETWRKEPANEADSYRVKYYKGLGTHSRDEVQEYFRNLDYHVKEFVWEGDKDGKAILLAFSKGKTAAENRRDWLQPEKNLAGLEPEENLFIDPSQKTIPYTDFLNKEYIHCARAHNQRSIPSVVDGLKPCQRKILFSAFNKPLDEEMKVDQLCGYVSENSAYHHGIDSVEGAIVRMAQDFIGTNNIPLLYPGGQFGTRKMGGLDHADGRYICTKLSPITRLIFQKADEPLLDYLNEDGQSIEPKWYFPIIPMILVNGCKGIGTGWKTSVPCFNPFEIIESLKLLIKDKELTDELVPWYKGFNGTIEVAKHSKSHCDIKIH